MHNKLKLAGALVALSLLSACTTDVYPTHVITGTPRASIDADQVKLYAEPPAKYEVIAVLNVRAEDGLRSDQKVVDAAVKGLKAEAAKLGANGVIIQGLSNSSKSTGGVIFGDKDFGLLSTDSIDQKSIQGKAIYVMP